MLLAVAVCNLGHLKNLSIDWADWLTGDFLFAGVNECSVEHEEAKKSLDADEDYYNYYY